MTRNRSSDAENTIDLGPAYRRRQYHPLRPSLPDLPPKALTREERAIVAAAREKAAIIVIERNLGLLVQDALKSLTDHEVNAWLDTVDRFNEILAEDRSEEDEKLILDYRKYTLQQLLGDLQDARRTAREQIGDEHERSLRPSLSNSALAVLVDWMSSQSKSTRR